MKSQTPKYSEHYETITALVTYLAVCNRYSDKFKKTIDNNQGLFITLNLHSYYRLAKLIISISDGLFNCSKFFACKEIKVSRSFSGGQVPIVLET